MAQDILCTSLTSPVDLLLVAFSAEGVCRVVIGGDMATFIARLAHRSRFAVAEAPRQPSDIALQFADYFAGTRRRFTLPLDCRFATPFQQLLFQELLRISPGQVVSYGDVARAIGRPRAARGVGSALSRNPLPILVPCHRVIHKDGTLAGYSAGVHVKEYLLVLEGVLLPIQW